MSFAAAELLPHKAGDCLQCGSAPVQGLSLWCGVGRGSGVKRLQRLGMVSSVPGMSALDMNTAEDAVVRNTREVVPGMVICGMEACQRPMHPARN